MDRTVGESDMVTIARRNFKMLRDKVSRLDLDFRRVVAQKIDGFFKRQVTRFRPLNAIMWG
jgi:hypothetical protein